MPVVLVGADRYFEPFEAAEACAHRGDGRKGRGTAREGTAREGAEGPSIRHRQWRPCHFWALIPMASTPVALRGVLEARGGWGLEPYTRTESSDLRYTRRPRSRTGTPEAGCWDLAKCRRRCVVVIPLKAILRTWSIEKALFDVLFLRR